MTARAKAIREELDTLQLLEDAKGEASYWRRKYGDVKEELLGVLLELADKQIELERYVAGEEAKAE